MLERDIGGYWLKTGQEVSITAKYYAGKTGVIVGVDRIGGGYFIRMNGSGHVLPFRECEFAEKSQS